MWWYTTAVPAIWETEEGGSQVQGQPWKSSDLASLCLKISKRSMIQVSVKVQGSIRRTGE